MRKSSNSIESYKNEIETSNNQIIELQKENQISQEKINKLNDTLKDKDVLPSGLLKMEGLEQQLKNKIKTLDKNVKFYEENDICPSCKQDIQQHHKECVFKEKKKEKLGIEEVISELVEKIQDAEKRLNEINSTLERMDTIEKKINKRQNEINSSQQYVGKMQKSIEFVLTEGTEVSETKNELNQLIGENKEHTERRKELIEDRHYYGIASALLKDSGIKSKIIKHYLPIMNKLINKYLVEMDFFCQFNLDENFNETIKSRHRDEFTYHSFSEGERLRIDLSLLLAWAGNFTPKE